MFAWRSHCWGFHLWLYEGTYARRCRRCGKRQKRNWQAR